MDSKSSNSIGTQLFKMAPREETNPFRDQYLTIEYDATIGPIVMPDGDGGAVNEGDEVDHDNIDIDDPPQMTAAVTNDDDDLESSDNEPVMMQEDTGGRIIHPHNELQLPPSILESNSTDEDFGIGRNIGAATRRPRRRQINRGIGNGLHVGSSPSNEAHVDVDPLAIDMTNPDEEEAWNITSAMLVDSPIATTSNVNYIIRTASSPVPPPTVHSIPSSSRNLSNSISQRRSVGSFSLSNSFLNTSPIEQRNSVTPFAASPSPSTLSNLRQYKYSIVRYNTRQLYNKWAG